MAQYKIEYQGIEDTIEAKTPGSAVHKFRKIWNCQPLPIRKTGGWKDLTITVVPTVTIYI